MKMMESIIHNIQQICFFVLLNLLKDVFAKGVAAVSGAAHGASTICSSLGCEGRYSKIISYHFCRLYFLTKKILF